MTIFPFPNKKQYQNWSLPSKYSLLGLIVGILGIIITLIIFFYTDHTELNNSNNVNDKSLFSYGLFQEINIKYDVKSGKYGYANKQGQFIIEPKFDMAYEFNKGFALTIVNNKWVIIDKKGKQQPENNYDAYLSTQNIARVRLGEKWAFISRSGKKITDFIYDKLYYYFDGLALAKRFNKYGYINKNGDVAIEFIYDDAYRFDDGIAKVVKDGRVFYINIYGACVKNCKFQHIKNKRKGNPNEKIIIVNNAQEFIDAIGSNRTIQIKGNIYLKNISNYSNHNVTTSDYSKIIISNIMGLHIVGVNKQKSKIIAHPHDGLVIKFVYCNNIRLENLSIGHEPLQKGCNGGVLEADNVYFLDIYKTTLFGCGITGFESSDVGNVSFENSTIEHCSIKIADLSGNNIVFNKCTFQNNNSDVGSYFFINTQKNPVKFNNCVFKNNKGGSTLFRTNDNNNDKVVILNSCLFYNNELNKISNNSNNVRLINTNLKKSN